MKIVIIGDGKVGHKLTIQLSEENYDVVAELPARKETGGKAHDRPCKESDLLSADRSFERGLKTEYGCQPGTYGCI